MLDLQNIILAIIISLNLFLSVFILARGRINEGKVAYSMFVLCITLWTIGVTMIRYTANLGLESEQIFWMRATLVAASFIGTSILYFGLAFPYVKHQFTNLTRVLLHLPNLFIFMAVIWPGIMNENAGIYHQEGRLILLWEHFWYGLYFIIVTGLAFIKLGQKYRESRGIDRVQAFYVIVGLALGVPVGLISNVLFVLRSNRLDIVIFLGFIA